MQCLILIQGFVTRDKSNIEPVVHKHLLCARPPGPLNLTSTQSFQHSSVTLHHLIQRAPVLYSIVLIWNITLVHLSDFPIVSQLVCWRTGTSIRYLNFCSIVYFIKLWGSLYLYAYSYCHAGIEQGTKHKNFYSHGAYILSWGEKLQTCKQIY